MEGDIEPCQLGLYTVTLSSKNTRREFPVLCGIIVHGRPLSEEECKALLALPMKDCTEDGPRSAHWLKRGGPPHKLDALVPVGAMLERDAVTSDRLKRLALEKQATRLRRELMKGRESQFFDAMRLDVELEEQMKQFAEQEKLTAKVTREFVVEVKGTL